MSNPAIGTKAYLAIIEESDFNTPDITKSAQKLSNALYGESVMIEAGKLVSNAINENRGVLDVRVGQYKSAGSIPFELSQNGMGLLWKIFGGKVTTTAVGAKYQHVFTRGVPTSFTLIKSYKDVGQYQELNGCFLTGYKHTISPDGLATGTFDIMGSGKSLETATDPYPTPTVFAHSAYSNFDAVFFEGAVQAKLLSFNFDIKNGAFDNRVIGSQYSDYIGAANGEIMGEVVVQFRDFSWINKIKTEGRFDLKLKFTRGLNSFTFEFPVCQYTGQVGAAINTKEGITLAIKFDAMIDQNPASPTFNTDYQVTIVDDQPTV